MSHDSIYATLAGVPRIGPHRELKKALENYWQDQSTGGLLGATQARLSSTYTAEALAAGLESVPVSGPSFYDAMLDTSTLFGVLPERTDNIPDHICDCLPRWIDRQFAAARGTESTSAAAMTKWFDTNYHYLVPELSVNTQFSLDPQAWINSFTRLRRAVGNSFRPVFIGPATFLALSRTTDDSDPLDHLETVFRLYTKLLAILAEHDIYCVQIDEPILVTDFGFNMDATLRQRIRQGYEELAQSSVIHVFVQTYFGDGDAALKILSGVGLTGIGVDLVSASSTLNNWSGEELLLAGVVDGRNVWRTDIDAALAILRPLANRGPIAVSTSCSLLHVPYSLSDETDLRYKRWLAFGDEKIREVIAIARLLQAERNGEAIPADAQALLQLSREVVAERKSATVTHNPQVRQRVSGIVESDRHREDFAYRRRLQADSLDLPPLPTTTIGSFPQTKSIRSARARLRKGELSQLQYEELMRDEIADVIAKQEQLGLDVLVHGEPERNDMVQYFAEQIEGFLFTANGWVQSYGSRCVRPPILYGDVSRPKPMTVQWFRAAQALTDKPVKGMLTGPITMLAWSFVRDDQPLGETADQVALALRDEIADLTDAGAKIIQVDEPAIRELLPLREVDQPAYLKWAVGSFRLATGGAPARVQIHTHMCYSEFNELIGPISMLDADVTSIEAARNGMQVLAALKENGYTLGIGPGVWDIHSPRVPAQEEVDGLISDALENVAPELLWVNPDCGLKTRRWPETTASLEVLVKAAAKARANLLSRV